MLPFRFIASTVSLATAIGCGDVVAVHVSPFPPCQTLALGDSIYVLASADRSMPPVRAYSSITRPEVFAWSTSAPDVMTVSPSGVIRAISVGTASVTASADGFSGSADFRVELIAQTAAITPPSGVFAVGDTVLLTAHAWDSTGVPIDLVLGQTLFSTAEDARVVHIWEQLPSGARLLGLAKGTAPVSWAVGRRCGVLSAVVH